MKPGEYILMSDNIEANKGRKTVRVTVSNTGDRPVQIGSHFHFFEANKALDFDRAQAFGMRLNIPAGTAVRFEPGEERDVVLVELGGKRTIYGLNNLTNGSVRSESGLGSSLRNARLHGFKGVSE